MEKSGERQRMYERDGGDRKGCRRTERDGRVERRMEAEWGAEEAREGRRRLHKEKAGDGRRRQHKEGEVLRGTEEAGKGQRRPGRDEGDLRRTEEI